MDWQDSQSGLRVNMTALGRVTVLLPSQQAWVILYSISNRIWKIIEVRTLPSQIDYRKILNRE